MTLQMTIPNMACSACGDTITQAVKKIDPTANVQANPKTKQVMVDTQAAQSNIQQVIEAAGYQVENIVVETNEHPAEQRAAEDLNQDL